MYKISINDHSFYLLKYEDADFFRPQGYELIPYMGDLNSLYTVVEKLESSEDEHKIGFYASNFKQLKSDFKSLYRKISAMGGIVTNPAGEVLFIYRRGMWDLPKGKREKNETRKECALREVAEETGLHHLNIKSKIGKTRHTYRIDSSGERILKVTYWYEMESAGDEVLVPQYEEDIEDAKWMTTTAFMEGNYVTFANINDILKEFRSMRIEMK